ncbi:MAG: GlyGly-CTERM sorting domain-containing protein [Bacteroidaceae bacterium]|nr:GlyGly-CTERM sorting domain-containing protein [Bacteroidaceae bacterium]MBQ6800342.1 GlyGly-CTERM sorting domain-containing protein [Bacteroidaceae bacterium]MBR6590569.1 GlyGly-CTERM sorting domain-containing protein [Bacteroidaceae bacterium]
MFGSLSFFSLLFLFLTAQR